VGGQDSPGPAYAALSKRHALSFGNRLKSSNSMIKLQENQARKYNEYKKNSEDPDQLIQQTLKTIKQRAQSASPMRKDLVGNRPPSATTPFSRSLNNQRPVSAHSSPDIRIYTPTSSSSSSTTAAAASFPPLSCSCCCRCEGRRRWRLPDAFDLASSSPR
jgi:hypothetical protein